MDANHCVGLLRHVQVHFHIVSSSRQVHALSKATLNLPLPAATLFPSANSTAHDHRHRCSRQSVRLLVHLRRSPMRNEAPDREMVAELNFSPLQRALSLSSEICGADSIGSSALGMALGSRPCTAHGPPSRLCGSITSDPARLLLLRWPCCAMTLRLRLALSRRAVEIRERATHANKTAADGQHEGHPQGSQVAVL